MATEVPEPILPEIDTRPKPVRARQVAPLGSMLIMVAGLLTAVLAWWLGAQTDELLDRQSKTVQGWEDLLGDSRQAHDRQGAPQRKIARARRIASVQFSGMCLQGGLLAVVGVSLLGFRVRVPSGGDRRLRAAERVFSAYAFLLMAGVAQVAVVYYGELAAEEPMAPSKALMYACVLEAFFTLVVLLMMVEWVSLPGRRAEVTPNRRAMLWLAFAVIALGMVGLGVLYERLVHFALDVPVDSLAPFVMADPSLLPVWLIVICVQPAVIEELFFRYLMLDAVQGVTGKHAAVFLVALLFALIHIGAPLSVPILFVLGVLLGYARVISGRIALPMLMHLIYNAGVLAVALGLYRGLV